MKEFPSIIARIIILILIKTTERIFHSRSCSCRLRAEREAGTLVPVRMSSPEPGDDQSTVALMESPDMEVDRVKARNTATAGVLLSAQHSHLCLMFSLSPISCRVYSNSNRVAYIYSYSGARW